MFQVSRSNWIDFVLHVIDPASSVGKNQNKQTRELFGNVSGRLIILGNLRLLKGCRLMLRWWPLLRVSTWLSGFTKLESSKVGECVPARRSPMTGPRLDLRYVDN